MIFFPVANMFGAELDVQVTLFPVSLFRLDWFRRADAFMDACGSLLHQAAVSTLTNQTMSSLGPTVVLVSLIRDALQFKLFGLQRNSSIFRLPFLTTDHVPGHLHWLWIRALGHCAFGLRPFLHFIPSSFSK